MTQYLKREDFSSKVQKESEPSQIELLSTDSYNETLIMKKIESMNIKILFGIALNFAIVGFGSKSYGSVKIKDEVIDIKTYMNNNNIIYSATLNTKLKEDDLTPRRLIRFFRYYIFDYLSNNKDVNTYFYRKYVEDKSSEEFRNYMFPGAEHLLEPKTDIVIAKELIKAYRKLDLFESEKNRKPIDITSRILRVLNAKGFNTSDLI